MIERTASKLPRSLPDWPATGKISCRLGSGGCTAYAGGRGTGHVVAPLDQPDRHRQRPGVRHDMALFQKAVVTEVVGLNPDTVQAEGCRVFGRVAIIKR